MAFNSLGRSVPVAICVNVWLTFDSFNTSRAPSLRGWMFNEPGVAMKHTTSPPVKLLSSSRLPSERPESYSGCPM
jgi:hypothetical protein